MITNRYDAMYARQIENNVIYLRQRIANAAEKSGRSLSEIQFMAVTKTVPAEYVNVAIKQGISLLGENRAQEFLSKRAAYQLDSPNIHFIGHLQTNKVSSIIQHVGMIESVDSIKLAQKINSVMQSSGQQMEVLLEVNIGNEPTKSGFLPEQISEALHSIAQFPYIRIKGFMCIPPKERAEYFFPKMQQLYLDSLCKNVDNINMQILSMGMSHDFETAISYGSNIVRIGTALFGQRNVEK